MKRLSGLACARRIFITSIVLWIVIFALFNQAEAAEKRWNLDEVQYQVSPDCSHAIQVYVRRAVQKLSAHSVNLSEGGDDIYISCENSNPFNNALSYLSPGTASEVEELQLGVTKTVWVKETRSLLSAHIWIDPKNGDIFGNLEGVVYHEFGHAIGMPHVRGGIMQSNTKLNHIDSATIVRIRELYGRARTSVIDSEGVYYISCLFVPKALARLAGASEGFYDIQMKDNEIVDYEKVECATK